MHFVQALSAEQSGHFAHSVQVAQFSPGLHVLHSIPVFVQNPQAADEPFRRNFAPRNRIRFRG